MVTIFVLLDAWLEKRMLLALYLGVFN